MVGGLSGRGNEHGERLLDPGFEDGHEGRSLARRTEDDHGGRPTGRGNGPLTHSRGSRSAIDHRLILAQDLGCLVIDCDVFSRMHKKANGQFVNKRSEKVAEEVIECYNAATKNQTDDGENSSITRLMMGRIHQ